MQSYGLIVNDPAKAVSFLSHVSYYRLSGYCLAFETNRHSIIPGTTFEQIIEAYYFDFQLRDLVTRALEVIEIDLKTTTAYHFGKQYNAFGHIAKANFFTPPPKFSKSSRPSRFDHDSWLEKLRDEADRSRELFTNHFRNQYEEFPDLPIWVATEIMSFGTLSKMIDGLKTSDQRAIAGRYGLQTGDFISWTHHLSVVRNSCAHHARIWDRIWAVKPIFPPGNSWKPPHIMHNQRMSAVLLVIYQCLKKCTLPEIIVQEWKIKVDKVLGKPPAAPNANEKMGINDAWFQGPLWQ